MKHIFLYGQGEVMMKINVRYWMKNLIVNLKYLMTHNLYEGDNSLRLKMLDIVNWHITDKRKCRLNILNQEQTLEILKNNPKSFCRFGDGEVDLMEGRDIPFQKYSAELVDYYFKILSDKHENLYIGLNYYYYHDFDIFNKYTSDFYKIYSCKYGKFFMDHCNEENIYIDASFNQIYQSYSDYDFERYYNDVKNLFLDKKIVVFAGKGIMNKLHYNLFDRASELIYEDGPSTNAFAEFSHLLEKASSYSRDYLLCFILGPASKVLVYELSNRGYCAWDIGHLAKDYISYMSREERIPRNFAKFYAPD